MQRPSIAIALLPAVVLCGCTIDEPEQGPPGSPPVVYGPRGGGEEGMNCMGAGYETVVSGPSGPVSVPTRTAVARFVDELQLSVAIDGGALFRVEAPSFDPIAQGTWREKFFQVVLPATDAMAGEGPSGDLIAGHFDLAHLEGTCLEDGDVNLDAIRDLVKIYLYSLIQGSECPPPHDIEGSFAAVELVMLYPGEAYRLARLEEQGVIRSVPPGQLAQYLCAIDDGDLTGISMRAGGSAGTTQPPTAVCLWELGMLEAVVDLAAPPPTAPGGIEVGSVPVSFAGHDPLGGVGAVRTFLRHPTQAIGDVVEIQSQLGCAIAAAPCPPEEITVTMTFGVTRRDQPPGVAELLLIDDGPAAAVLIPFDSQVACLPDCPPVVPALDDYTCEGPAAPGQP